MLFKSERIVRIGLRRNARKLRREGRVQEAEKLEWVLNNEDALSLTSVAVEEKYEDKAPPVFGAPFGNGWLLFLTFILDNADEIMAIVERIIDFFTNLNEDEGNV